MGNFGYGKTANNLNPKGDLIKEAPVIMWLLNW